jgi:flagellar hook assembly protein FlgD
LFRVVNRWGAIVFEEQNYRNDWEGTNQNGESLPSGTYFVVFEANGQAHSTFVDIRR